MAKKNNIRVVFAQPQYSMKGASLIAHQVGAKVITLDPYSKDYFSSMREITKEFSSSLK